MTNNAKHIVGSPVLSEGKHFGTDGIRGKAGTFLSPALALQLGYWTGKLLEKEGPILIGKDSRESGDMLTSALSAGLTAAGRDVWTIGLCPTPAIPCLIRKFNTAGGIMVSASHNPPGDNGIKIFEASGCKINKELQNDLENHLQGCEISTAENKSKAYGKSYKRFELLEIYEETLIESVKERSLNGVSIILDLCWGSATANGKSIFKKLGANITALHGEPDGKKINVGCGSTNINLLRQAVLEKGADMGFAFDGDSDRMIGVDGEGRLINGDHVLYLWGLELKERNLLPGNRLVSTVMSNVGFELEWKAKGGILSRTPVGDQNVYAEIINKGAYLGGEPSGHILSSINNYSGDGLLSALQISTICKNKGLSLSQWMDQSFKPFPQKLINVQFKRDANYDKWENCEPLNDAVLEAEAAIGGRGRVLLRPSGTEPLLRVMVEAQDPSLVNSWTKRIAELAEKHLDVA